MNASLAVVWVNDIGSGFREALFMFWETLWALVLGFTLSGAVQAFVSKETMQRSLGTHRPAAVARAAGFGMVSSSCSYAASAMAKSLFQKGADLVSATAFMVASTNLVVELGLVILVLLGWQFTVAEFTGGPFMIVLLALFGGFVLRGPLVAGARQRIENAGKARERESAPGSGTAREGLLERGSWRGALTSKSAWAEAAGYSVADLKMLRRDLAVGYLAAGFIAVLVPIGWWNVLFLHGHGVWTAFENALVGPVIAVVSFVCSIGNVPLAAALWRGGISFGGVVAFIFADLIALPLVLIYRKYYGAAVTVRLVALLYGVMVAAGLGVQLVFSAAGIVPPARMHGTLVREHFGWDYTTFLNIASLIVAVALYWLYRKRERFGGVLVAIDPVCGMQVRISGAPASSQRGDEVFYFCSDRCRERYEAKLECPPAPHLPGGTG